VCKERNDLKQTEVWNCSLCDRAAKQIPLMKLEKGNGSSSGGLSVECMQWVPRVKEIEGVPVCESYKYLGTILTPKLSFIHQIKAIKKKATYIRTRLYPYLKTGSLETRKDMFMTFAMPMFDAALILLNYEPSKSNKEKLIRTQRGLFKDFIMMSKGTKSNLVDDW